MQMSLLYKNTKKYKYHCGSSLFDVIVFNETEFSLTNFHFLSQNCSGSITESPLDTCFFYKLLTALNEVLAIGK